MININKCKEVAKNLANQSREKLGEQKLNDFLDNLDRLLNIELNINSVPWPLSFKSWSHFMHGHPIL